MKLYSTPEDCVSVHISQSKVGSWFNNLESQLLEPFCTKTVQRQRLRLLLLTLGWALNSTLNFIVTVLLIVVKINNLICP